MEGSRSSDSATSRVAAHKVNSDNQLSLTPAVTLHFGGRPGVVRSREVACWSAIASCAGVAGRATGNGRAALHLGRDLGGITSDGSSSIDRRRTADHLRGRSTCLTCTRWTRSQLAVRDRQTMVGGWCSGGRYVMYVIICVLARGV